jgi:hypothetical protein
MEREPFDIMELMPEDTPYYMAPAWLGALSLTSGQADAVAEFRRDTGNTWSPSRNGIELAIDKATGADEAFIRDFVAWFNVNIWGLMDGRRQEEKP